MLRNEVNQRFCFLTEFYDPSATLVRHYQVFYYPSDGAIEIYDPKNNRIFLKRIKLPTVSFKDLYKGNEINIFSRLHKIVEYGDDYTKKYFEKTRSTTYGMIKPDGYMNIGKIIDMIYNVGGFTIGKLKLCRMSKENASIFYAEHQGKPFYNFLIDYITSDFIVGMELIKEDAIKAWRSFIGPTNVDKAKAEAPNSLRAIFGNGGKNTVHGSDSEASVKRECALVFNKIRHEPYLTNCSCLVIKPHAIKEGNAGKIIDIILTEGFEISSMQMFYIDKIQAEEFFQVYKGVLPEYSQMIDSMSCGPIIAMEIRQDDVVNKLRNLVGPQDPDIAKKLRPNTIRAKFGRNRVFNAVHCTDLEEDAVLECDYFFNKLASYKPDY